MAHRNETRPGSAGEPGLTKFTAPNSAACREDAVFCERCGNADMYRMRAAWRCPECGFKTDCCGW